MGKLVALYGRDGAARMARIHREMIGGEGPRILIVPDQFTLQAERELIGGNDLPGAMQMEVLSPTRLMSRVFELSGRRDRAPITSQGRCMALRRVIDELDQPLAAFASVAGKTGFLAQMEAVITRMKACGILPQAVAQEAARRADTPLGDKLADTARLYQGLEDLLGDRFADSQDDLDELIARLPGNPWVGRARFWWAYFDVFTVKSCLLMAALARHSLGLTVSMALDPGARDEAVFQVDADNLTLLAEQAARQGVALESVAVPGEGGDRAPELAHLSRELYAQPCRVYPEAPGAIRVVRVATPYDEMTAVADAMVAAARGGMRWRDMALVCTDLDRHSATLAHVLASSGVACFVDRKRDVGSHPLARALVTLLDMAAGRLRAADVLDHIACGYTALSRDQAETLAAYARATGIGRDLWRKPFTRGEPERAAQAEAARQVLMGPVEDFLAAVKGSPPVAAVAAALFAYLEQVGAPALLEGELAQLEAEGLAESAAETAQIWNRVMAVLDQLVVLLGERHVPLADLSGLLQAGLEALQVGILPTAPDQVVVGNLKRSKLERVRALFVIGANDGLFPQIAEPAGLLAEGELAELAERGWRLSGAEAEDEARRDLYETLGKPTEQLYISYAAGGPEGEAMRPALLIGRLMRLFPQLTLSAPPQGARADHRGAAGSYPSLVAGLAAMRDGAGGSADLWQLYDGYAALPDYAEPLARLKDALLDTGAEQPLSRPRRAYPAPVQASVSRLESYAQCPYRHFVAYALKPELPREYALEGPDTGNLLHAALDNYAAELSRRGLTLASVDRAQSDAAMEAALAPVLEQYRFGLMRATRRLEHLSGQLGRVAKRAVWTLAGQARRSQAQPLGHEIVFGPGGTHPAITIELPSGERVYLRGRIDRADLLRLPEGDYVTVTDYKTGAPTLSPGEMYYGVKLQLLLYLAALTDLEGAAPAGLFYFHIDDPWVESLPGEQMEREIFRQLRLRGLVLQDAQVLRGLDALAETQADVLPVRFKKDGELAAGSSAVPAEVMAGLLARARALAARFMQEILSGATRAAPLKQGPRTACDWCDYRGICKFDPAFEAHRYRQLPELTMQELTEKLEEDAHGDA